MLEAQNVSNGTLEEWRHDGNEAADRNRNRGLRRLPDIWVKGGHCSELVITRPSGKPPRPSFVRIKYLEPVLTQAKLKGTIHGLRSEFSTLLAEAGTPLKTIATTMGHAESSIMLDSHEQSDPTAQRAAINRLEVLLAKSGGAKSDHRL